MRGGAPPFAAIVVVNSQGSRDLADSLACAELPVLYEDADVNLGSAGNLARRLQLAAGIDADWCFAINHDGAFDVGLVEELARRAMQAEQVGAVYPARRWLSRGGTSLRPHTSFFRAPRHTSDSVQVKAASDARIPLMEVAWDSSNGALYGLAAVRGGAMPNTDLWHGWEDLDYGLVLRHRGWKQYFCSDVTYLDDYEYQELRILGRRFFIAQKPPWLGYYLVRNMLLITRRSNAGPEGTFFVANRILREFVFTLFFRVDKFKRLKMIMLGLRDGLLQRGGRHPEIPAAG